MTMLYTLSIFNKGPTFIGVNVILLHQKISLVGVTYELVRIVHTIPCNPC